MQISASKLASNTTPHQICCIKVLEAEILDPLLGQNKSANFKRNSRKIDLHFET